MKVEYAVTNKVEILGHVADDFMDEIFDLKPVDYVISDESQLRDFTDFGASSTGPVWKRIKDSYAIDRPCKRGVAAPCITSLWTFSSDLKAGEPRDVKHTQMD